MKSPVYGRGFLLAWSVSSVQPTNWQKNADRFHDRHAFKTSMASCLKQDLHRQLHIERFARSDSG
jgi:hypothetical protein